MRNLLVACSLTLVASFGWGAESLTHEPDGNSYNFVTHYSVEIDAPAATVWENLIDLRSWMYDFEMQPVSGFDDLEGRVLRLYEGQDFFVQITSAVPGKLLVLANLPTTMAGEQLSAGTSVTTLTEFAGKTTVHLTMSRRYTWTRDGENDLKKRRQSDAFINATRATWERFLAKLEELSTT